jgi:thiamine-phosphate pyrophosphorylase
LTLGAESHRARIERYLPALMLVTDSSRLADRHIADVVRAAIDGGVNMVQVREQALSHEERLALSRQLRGVVVDRAMLFVNNDALAAALSASDLHLPESTTHPGTRGSMAISRSVHRLDAAERAEAEGADMLVLGTVFSSQSHPGGPTIGIEGVREVCERVSVPVIGIGGITKESAGDVIRAGASGVAVISAIFDAPDPRAAAAELRGAVDEAWAERTR